MDAIRRGLSRLRGARGVEWLLLILLAAAGVLLLTGGEASSAAGTGLERRMENVLSCVAGAGRVRVLVNDGETTSAFASSAGRASGVVVVAEGANSLRVAMELQQAVQALLGLDAERIEVLCMEAGTP